MYRTFRNVVIATIFITSLSVATAEEVHFDVGFESLFDNREYSGIEGMNYRSGTDFAARLTPKVGWEFCEGNRLYFGADIIKPFDDEDSAFFDSVKSLLYYAYDSSEWSVAMGVFERERISAESYSTAFFSDDYLFYDNRVAGVMARYMRGESFVEFVCDWEGQPSQTEREKFRLLSAGRKYWSNLYVGHNISVTHFAGQDALWLDNVVDNILVNPCIGVRFGSGEFDFDVKLSYLQSLQRDRSYEDEWLTPAMGEVAFKVSKGGFSIDERCYIGGDIMPLYEGHVASDGTIIEYGAELYTGDQLFRSDGGYYNRAAFSYERSLLEDRLALRVAFITHLTKAGFGTEQQISLNLKIGKTLYTK